ncbi:PREDICTED: eukaryotic translation initiation factor 3 subunit A isoform X1 [Theobroma cacao]|uniref:Eukaryotic translation initiation factor 3 subunit A isoform X1 n=1 Tax=Theobroma cacao TaxID=3641 RepID=A0AB32W1U6_THECC|nr:PREDICTED: eukaryotic translation initiation factor 3 subunit A isoform X1 [Theobroma cacao]XP_017972439.1 PREDICTED: eukaryotic translation initiation factor 3 subunit A isoform X1 [Theobroma cacao]XP_017972440.1 PREDICTED: eukaryotic translation initiation factor 3 subunit A isoform X1 [Theobroma cacao]XP_017972441.1 PREDICTED: eukaryotic translation initiation factor 3 subunit A isoform X1 [Theobroma cacao]
MNEEYDTGFAVAVAAAAYAINSLEEDEARRRIKTERLRNDTTTRVRNSDRVTRRYSSKEVRTAGETSSRKSKEQDYRRQESALTTRKPGHSSSARPMTMEAGDQRWKGNSSQLNVVETKADAWEKAQTEKVNRRYEDKKASILAWANEKKLRAKIKMERRKKELEQKIKRNQQFYQAKIARIDHVAGGARAQADEQRRNEELKVKEKARKRRASGQDPVTCFCF